jgi:peptide/nickel transport system permease protein
MGQYVAKRILLFLPTLLLISLIIFVLLRVIPGDPAIAILMGDQGDAGQFTEEELNEVRRQLGTDRPIMVQYSTWIWDLVRGQFGESMWYGQPVWDELKEKFPTTLELVGLALILSFVVAVPVGIISAVRQDSWPDYAARIFAIAGTALPNWWIGIIAIYVLLRVFGWVPPVVYAKFWEDPLQNLQQLILPAIVLGYYNMALVARVTRSAMLDVLREDYIRTAYSKGLREKSVIIRHALKNAFLPVLTISGWQVGVLLGGTVLVEQVFTVPGVGLSLWEGFFHRDFTMIQGIVFLVAGGVLVLNLFIDIAYGWLDPRIRFT